MASYGSFFSGVGVADLSAQNIGYENLFAVEIDNWCSKLLSQKFPYIQVYNDIKDFNGKKYYRKVDVVSGGFPCQDISINGSGEGIYGNKSSLWGQYFRCIQEVSPRYVIIENSSLLTQRGLEKILYDLSSIGYDAEWQTFFAYEWGKFHKRARVYIVAYPIIQGWRGILYYVKQKRNEINKVEKYKTLDSSRSAFLQFESWAGEPGVFRVDDGLAQKLDAKRRLSHLGNAMVYDIINDVQKIIFELL